MNCKVRRVPLAEIDSENTAYRITIETDLSSLTDSVAAVGLMNPPLLMEDDAGFLIISGFRRVEACRHLGWSDMEARVAPPDTPARECARWAIADNALQRPLNLIEMSRAFHLLSGFSEDLREMARTGAELGLPANHSMIRKVLPLCKLPVPVQEGLLAETIPLAIALDLDRLETDVALELARLFHMLRLSLNKQREVMGLVREISIREDLSDLEVIRSQAIQEILTGEDTDRNQKARQLRFYLKQRRFPAITRAEQTFEQHVRALKLGNGIRLIPPKNFEGTVYSLHLDFKNLSELQARKAVLDRIIEAPAIRDILR